MKFDGFVKWFVGVVSSAYLEVDLNKPSLVKEVEEVGELWEPTNVFVTVRKHSDCHGCAASSPFSAGWAHAGKVSSTWGRAAGSCAWRLGVSEGRSPDGPLAQKLTHSRLAQAASQASNQALTKEPTNRRIDTNPSQPRPFLQELQRYLAEGHADSAAIRGQSLQVWPLVE